MMQQDEDMVTNVLSPDLVGHPAILAFQASNSSFIVTSPQLAGNPIMYASPAFLELTGYTIDRVLGRNCRFLQGPETDPVAVARLREAVDQGNDVNVTLLNYRRDGSTFWNHILISAVRNYVTGEVTHFLGVQHLVQGPPPPPMPSSGHLRRNGERQALDYDDDDDDDDDEDIDDDDVMMIE